MTMDFSNSYAPEPIDTLDAVIEDLDDLCRELQAIVAQQDRRKSWALREATNIAWDVRVRADGS